MPSQLPSLVLANTLPKHTKPINTLSITDDGYFIVSGSDDGLVVIWDLSTGEEVQTISCLFNGPVSTAIWINLPQRRSICFGCADGTVHIYQQLSQGLMYDFASITSAHEGAVEDLAFDANHQRMASIGSGCLIIWGVDQNGVLSKHGTSAKRPWVARKTAFFDNGQSALICFLESHEVVAYQVDTMTQKWSHQLPTRIGHATLSADERMLIVSNLQDGVDTYSMPPVQLLRSFKHAISENVPLQVHSALQGALTLSGSDDGTVRLFEQRTGQVSELLPHGNVGTLVQTVTSHSDGIRCIVASGSSNKGSSNDIKVWSHTFARRADSSEKVSPVGSSFRTWQLVLLVLFTTAVHISIFKVPKEVITDLIGLVMPT